jgi:hypothetical protein
VGSIELDLVAPRRRRNVNWFVDVPQSPPSVIDGAYTSQDSNPATWSSNQTSASEGFCIVRGVPALTG